MNDRNYNSFKLKQKYSMSEKLYLILQIKFKTSSVIQHTQIKTTTKGHKYFLLWARLTSS